MTDDELQKLGNAIRASEDPEIIQAIDDGDAGKIASKSNEPNDPVYIIYRNNVPADEVRAAIDAQDIVDITEGDRGACVDLLDIRRDTGFSGAQPRDRSAWADIFSTAAGTNSREAIEGLWPHVATLAEEVFSLGTGTGEIGDPDTSSWQGTVTTENVYQALLITEPS